MVREVNQEQSQQQQQQQQQDQDRRNTVVHWINNKSAKGERKRRS
jgi:hypothetical protein